MLFRAPLICWNPKRRVVMNPSADAVVEIWNALPLDVTGSLFTFPYDLKIVEDPDTDSTPVRKRTRYRRMARKTILYADIFYDEACGVTESQVWREVEDLFSSSTFSSANMSFKIAATDHQAAEFLALV